MLAILLLMALGGCTDESDESAVATPEPRDDPPAALAEGSALPDLPQELTEAFDVVLVGTVQVEPDAPVVEACRSEELNGMEATYAGGYLSPHGVTLQFEVLDAADGRRLRTCDGFYREGGVEWCGGVYHPWSDDEELERAGHGLNTQCGPEDVALLSVVPAEGAAWVVHDLGSYAVAYPVTDGPVRISVPHVGSGDGVQADMVDVSEDGAVLRQRTVSAVVAG